MRRQHSSSAYVVSRDELEFLITHGQNPPADLSVRISVLRMRSDLYCALRSRCKLQLSSAPSLAVMKALLRTVFTDYRLQLGPAGVEIV